MMMTEKSEFDFAVLKINTALSNKPIFVRITDPTMSVDRIFAEAINTLSNSGKPLESQQLDQLYKQHQLFNNGKVIQKGDIFQDLEHKNQQIGDQQVIVAELDLVTSHSGGSNVSTELKEWQQKTDPSPNNWLTVSCDDCGKFIHIIHWNETGGIDAYFDENGHELNEDVRVFDTDTYAEDLCAKGSENFNILCHKCFQFWHK